MAEGTEQRELVERLAEEFVHRYRDGERPSTAEYVVAHPGHAAEIRELFPALVVMEELAPGDDESALLATDEGKGAAPLRVTVDLGELAPK